MNRRKRRELTFKLLFSEPFYNRDEYFENLNNAFTDDSSIIIDESDRLIIIDRVKKIIQNIDTIDQKISNNTRNWSIDRINKAVLAILRVGIYELLFDDDIPNKVAINEAIELSKSYADEDSFSFINALLAKVMDE